MWEQVGEGGERKGRRGEISSEKGGPWIWSRILFTNQFTGFASGQRTLHLRRRICSVRHWFFSFGTNRSRNSKLAVTYPYGECDLRDCGRSICLQIFTLPARPEILTITTLPLNYNRFWKVSEKMQILVFIFGTYKTILLLSCLDILPLRMAEAFPAAWDKFYKYVRATDSSWPTNYEA